MAAFGLAGKNQQNRVADYNIFQVGVQSLRDNEGCGLCFTRNLVFNHVTNARIW